MAKKKKDNNFFWIGYSDLMTTLFFVMLVLFAVVFISANPEKMGQFERENQRLKFQVDSLNNLIGTLVVTIEQYEEVVQIEKQFEKLKSDKDFVYLEDCKKYIAKDFYGIEIFKPTESIIIEDFIEPTKEIGRKIQQFLNELERQNPDLSYFLVIEGNMANTYDQKLSIDNSWGYKKSYERALAVYDLWNKSGIDFRKNNVEVIIAGSGFNGICRDPVEENNKRFSIQIIPKVSEPKDL